MLQPLKAYFRHNMAIKDPITLSNTNPRLQILAPSSAQLSAAQRSSLADTFLT